MAPVLFVSVGRLCRNNMVPTVLSCCVAAPLGFPSCTADPSREIVEKSHLDMGASTVGGFLLNDF